MATVQLHSNSYLSITPSVCLSVRLPQTLRHYMLTIADFTVRSTGVDSSIAIRRLFLMTAIRRLPNSRLLSRWRAFGAYSAASARQPGNRTNGTVCKRGGIKVRLHDTQVCHASNWWDFSQWSKKLISKISEDDVRVPSVSAALGWHKQRQP